MVSDIDDVGIVAEKYKNGWKFRLTNGEKPFEYLFGIPLYQAGLIFNKEILTIRNKLKNANRLVRKQEDIVGRLRTTREVFPYPEDLAILSKLEASKARLEEKLEAMIDYKARFYDLVEARNISEYGKSIGKQVRNSATSISAIMLSAIVAIVTGMIALVNGPNDVELQLVDIRLFYLGIAAATTSGLIYHGAPFLLLRNYWHSESLSYKEFEDRKELKFSLKNLKDFQSTIIIIQFVGFSMASYVLIKTILNLL